MRSMVQDIPMDAVPYSIPNVLDSADIGLNRQVHSEAIDEQTDGSQQHVADNCAGSFVRLPTEGILYVDHLG